MEPLKTAYTPSTQLIAHSLEGVKIFEPYPESDKPIPLLSLVKDGKDYVVESSSSGTRSAFYSPSGKFFIVDQFDIDKQSKEASRDFKFRPSDDFLIWRNSKKSIRIFSLPNDKSQSVYTLLDTLQTDQMIDTFCLSKSTKVEDKFIITLSSNHTKGQEGLTQIFEFPKYIKRPKFQVPHSAANETTNVLSPDGRSLLLILNLFVDKSGKSYYGSQRLLFIQIIGGKKKSEIPLIDGQLGDVAWNPNSCDFIVISGNQPATQVLYDSDGNAKFELGRSKRNTIIYSPHGNFICIAGFGNLAGEIDFFERGLTGRQKLIEGELQIKKLGDTKKAHCTTTYQWDPSGKYLLTGVLNPRISVQNEFKVFKYDGTLIQHQKFYETELYSVSWRPGMSGFWSEAPIKSPKPSKTYVLKGEKQSGKVQEEKKKDQSFFSMFTNSKFAALMQQEMGGKVSSKPRWLKGNQYDKFINSTNFVGSEGDGGCDQKLEKKKERIAPKQNWRNLKPIIIKDQEDGGGGSKPPSDMKGESSKKKKKKQKQKKAAQELEAIESTTPVTEQP